jgi:hypothetical protein
MKKLRKWLRKGLRARRGQAIVTYAILSAAMLSVGTFVSIRIFPDLMDAMDQFAGSMYMGINLPFP